MKQKLNFKKKRFLIKILKIKKEIIQIKKVPFFIVQNIEIVPLTSNFKLCFDECIYLSKKITKVKIAVDKASSKKFIKIFHIGSYDSIFSSINFIIDYSIKKQIDIDLKPIINFIDGPWNQENPIDYLTAIFFEIN